MRRAARFQDGEDMPHQRFGQPEPASTRVDGKIPHEGAGPRKRCRCEPPGCIADEKEKFRVELRIAGYARPPLVEPTVGSVVEHAGQQRMDVGRIGWLEGTQAESFGQTGACNAPSSERRSLTSFGPRGRLAGTAGRSAGIMASTVPNGSAKPCAAAPGRGRARSRRAGPCAWRRNNSRAGRGGRRGRDCRWPPARRRRRYFTAYLRLVSASSRPRGRAVIAHAARRRMLDLHQAPMAAIVGARAEIALAPHDAAHQLTGTS